MITTNRKRSTLKSIFLSFSISVDLFITTHCRYRGYCCTWSQPMTHTHTHTHIDRVPLDEGSAHRRNLYPTTHNNHKKQTSIPPAIFEPATPASKRPKTHRLDHLATGIGYRFSRVPIQHFAQHTIRHTLHYDSRRPIKVFLWGAGELQWTSPVPAYSHLRNCRFVCTAS